jgi:hypothetical protein
MCGACREGAKIVNANALRHARAEAPKIALFDLDGTLADFDGALRRDVAKCLPREWMPEALVYDGDPAWLENLKRLVRRQPGWWRDLQPFMRGWEILEEVRRIGFDVHVLTKGPASNAPAWGEKLEWCRKYLPDVPVTITFDKSGVYGRVLVDDYPPYVEAWLKNRPRGLAIMPAQPWNDEQFAERMRFMGRTCFRYDGTAGAAKTASHLLEDAFNRETSR